MKRRTIFLAILLQILLCPYQHSLAGNVKGQGFQSASPLVIAEAQQILLYFKSSRYSHKTIVDEEEGLYALDCSGLVHLILSRVAPKSLSKVPVDSGHARARAINYYNVFIKAPLSNSRSGWQRIPRLLDAEPGDFIAWRKKKIPYQGSTGHIVIVYQKPIMAEDNTVRVVVLDSTRSNHAQDTRQQGESGIGVGIIRFITDEIGAPVSFFWSDRSKKPKKLPIAIGRALYIP